MQVRREGKHDHHRPSGFTLIEISIVLVIIGFIIGGIMVGKNLIDAASARGDVSQIEKYNAAVRTFEDRYRCLPGDCPKAASFGFPARGQYDGQGDGDGLIMANDCGSCMGAIYEGIFTGEQGLFWADLSQAGFIEGKFNTATAMGFPAANTPTDLYLPAAKSGQGGYIFVWQGGWRCQWSGVGTYCPGDGTNYFGLSGTGGMAYTAGYAPHMSPALSVAQAYAIDTKADDGMPQTGSIMAMDGTWWASGGGFMNGDYHPADGGPVQSGDGVATPPSSTTCYDNGNVAGTVEKYSMSVNGGNNLNCSLSFKFQ